MLAFHLLFFWYAVVLPYFSLRKRAAYRRGAPEQKLSSAQLYGRVIFGQWFMVAGLLFLFRLFGIPFAALGLRAPEPLPLAVSAAVLVGAWTWWVRYQERALANPAKVAKMRERFGSFSLLVPMTDGEMRGWIALSFTAGVCEELLYRGFMGFYLSHWMPLPAAAVVASLIFGAAHLYQGWSNAFRPLALGVLHWGLYLATRSLVPGMLLHALVDVRSGFVLRRAFTEPAPAAA